VIFKISVVIYSQTKNIMAIDTQKNFSKFVESSLKAQKLVRSLLEDGEKLECTAGMRGKRICYAKGIQKNFTWYYEPEYKTIQITYTDGREEPEEQPKEEFFVVWIEGITPERGEKIKTLNYNNHTYTTKMSEALRVKREDIERVKGILRDRGVANWALEGAGTFHKVSYAPKGTLFKI
jgi:hypothetical protein